MHDTTRLGGRLAADREIGAPIADGAARVPRIAVAFDGTQHGWRGLERAVGMALDGGGSLTLLGVVEEPSPWLISWAAPLCAVTASQLRAESRSELLRHLAAARDEVPVAIELHTRLLEGRSASALAAACAGGVYDVLVCAPRPIGRLWRRLRPGCTQTLVAWAPIPVLAVPPRCG